MEERLPRLVPVAERVVRDADPVVGPEQKCRVTRLLGEIQALRDALERLVIETELAIRHGQHAQRIGEAAAVLQLVQELRGELTGARCLFELSQAIGTPLPAASCSGATSRRSRAARRAAA